MGPWGPVGFLGLMFMAAWLVVVGVGFRLLVENYIVDASILTAAMCDAVWCCVLWWLVVSLKFKFFLDSLLNVFLVIKLLRANGGCLGIWSRRRT